MSAPGSSDPRTSRGARDSGPPPLTREVLLFFRPFLRPHLRGILGCLVLLLITGTAPAIMGLLPAFLTANWRPESLGTLWWGLAGLLAFQLLLSSLSFVLSYWFAKISQSFTRDARLAVFTKMGRLPAAAMGEQSIGELANRSTTDVMRVQHWLAPLVPSALGDAVQFFFMAAALFWLSPGFALAVLPLLLLCHWVLRSLNHRLRHLSRDCQVRSDGLMTSFIEGASGYRDLVASGRFGHAAARFGESLDGLRSTAIRMTMAGYLGGAAPMLAFTLLLFGYYFFKLGQTEMAGDMEYLGRVMSFAGLLSGIQRPLLSVARFFTETAMVAPSFHALKDLLETAEVPDPPGGVQPVHGGVTAEHLTFRYGEGRRKVLDDVNFEIPDGSFTAVIGQTGSGKTTLFHLLLRLLEPSSGGLRIGGVPLAEIGLADLREAVGFIPQSPFIFDASIKENVLMGMTEEAVGSERLKHAIHLAQLDGLIASRASDGGLDAPVGSGGSSLSGGERQRVALARVFLRDPRVIVCDEYTANIDNATARLIQQALASHFAGRTRIVITHQLYTVRDADRIIVLERGRVSATGNHDEMLTRPGLYRDLWEVQKLA